MIEQLRRELSRDNFSFERVEVLEGGRRRHQDKPVRPARVGGRNTRCVVAVRLKLVSKGFSEERVRSSLFRLLKENVLCSIATVTEDQRAHINTAYFCYSDELELYFLSDPGSLHCQNLSSNSSMAMAIFPSSQQWGGPDRGVQLFGTCTQASGPQATKAQRLYVERFPAYLKWSAGLNEDDVGRGLQFYQFLVSRVKVLDESEFGEAVFVIADVRRGKGLS